MIWRLIISSPLRRGKKAKEKNNSACVSNLDDLVEGSQAKTTKYATKYAVNVFKVIFALNYYNKILKITYCVFLKMYNKIKRELYATDCECFEIKFYTADRLPCLAVKCSKNDHLNLEECTRQLTRMMDLMPSDFAAVNSTLPACAMIPNQRNFTRHDERLNFSTIFSDCQIGQVCLFQERSSAVTFILKFFPHRVVNLLNISSVFIELWAFLLKKEEGRRIQS